MGSFKVTKFGESVVKAAVPLQKQWLSQSNLDLLLPVKIDMNVFFCYRKPQDSGYSFQSAVNGLKKALSQALVPYYPLSGEMVANAAGEPELLCNNRGVDFVEAYADVELGELNLYKPEESVRGKFVPRLTDGMLAAQATQLRCGGVVVGCTFDHRIADAYSANMFWKSWAEMAQSKPLTTHPSFRRSLLSPRRPGRFDPSISNLYVPVSKLIPPQTLPPPLVSRIYSVPADQINRLQLQANHGNPNSLISKRTKIEAFSAYLWKLIAAGVKAGDGSCGLGIGVDGRKRMAAGEMDNYFGNVMSYSSGKMKNKELEEMSLSSIANEIHSFLQVAVNKEHFHGLIDFIEAHRPEMVVSTVMEEKVTNESPFLMVSSGRGFPITKMDFGWGGPVFGSYLNPPDMPFSYVLPLPSSSENGDWVVYLCLPEDQVEVIENNASHVFKQFQLDGLNAYV